MTVASIGLIVLSQTTTSDGTYLELLAGLFPMAVGMGLTFVPLTLIATTNIRNDDAGLASGVFNTSQQVGGALGLAVLAAVANGRTDGVQASPPVALTEGFQAAFLVGAALAVVGAVLTVVLIRSRDSREHRDAALAGEPQPVAA